MDTFKTEKLELAAFLVAKGFEVVRMEWVTDNLCVFSVEGLGSELTSCAGSFYDGEQVHAQKYSKCMTELKRDMFKAKKKKLPV